MEPRNTLREVLAGNIDALYLDRQEVRVDRIVGDVTFRGAITGISDNEAAAVYLPPVVRWGLVVEEDPQLEDAATVAAVLSWSKYNLWEAQDLAQTEWMFLSQPEFTTVPWPGSADTNAMVWQSHEHIDIRVKRKLGKADRLWMVMSYANGIETVSATTYQQVMFEAHMLRCVLVA